MEERSFTQNSNFGFLSQDNSEKPPKPNNHLALAIVGTVFGFCSPCCIGLILGIISIAFSTQVDKKYDFNDFYGAVDSSKNAKILGILAIVFGILGIIQGIVFFATGGIDEYMMQYQEILSSYNN